MTLQWWTYICVWTNALRAYVIQLSSNLILFSFGTVVVVVAIVIVLFTYEMSEYVGVSSRGGYSWHYFLNRSYYKFPQSLLTSLDFPFSHCHSLLVINLSNCYLTLCKITTLVLQTSEWWEGGRETHNWYFLHSLANIEYFSKHVPIIFSSNAMFSIGGIFNCHLTLFL